MSEAEQQVFLGRSNSLKTQNVGFRLTQEAIDIIDGEAKRYGVNRTRGLEILLRRYRRTA